MGLRTFMKLERRIEEYRIKALGWGKGNKIVMWFREKEYWNEGKRKWYKIGGEVEEKIKINWEQRRRWKRKNNKCDREKKTWEKGKENERERQDERNVKKESRKKTERKEKKERWKKYERKVEKLK